ncbi:MAG: hypothetical protein JJE04_21505, partial [Acidobacteriia bacterium]|nr:hypothetical protein [Terriglobia bacterium]
MKLWVEERAVDETRTPDNLAGRALSTISRYSMFSPEQRVGVAVSGGADSVALLHVLAELAPQWNLSLHVLHLNHGLRGEHSDDDEEFVRKMAASLRLAYTGKRVAVGNEPGNLEERARDARQKFFLEAMREHGL